jgi:hypothetical protein
MGTIIQMYLSKGKARDLIELDRERQQQDIPDDAKIFCRYCNGTGLQHTVSENGCINWDGVSYCSHCRGFGFWDWCEFITKNVGGK